MSLWNALRGAVPVISSHNTPRGRGARALTVISAPSDLPPGNIGKQVSGLKFTREGGIKGLGSGVFWMKAAVRKRRSVCWARC